MSESNMGESDAGPNSDNRSHSLRKREGASHAPQVAHHYIVPPPRDLSLIRFALHRLMERAYWLAAAAAQDISGRHFKPGAAEAFLKDAEDAEALLGRLKEGDVVFRVPNQRQRGACTGSIHAHEVC